MSKKEKKTPKNWSTKTREEQIAEQKEIKRLESLEYQKPAAAKPSSITPPWMSTLISKDL